MDFSSLEKGLLTKKGNKAVRATTVLGITAAAALGGNQALKTSDTTLENIQPLKPAAQNVQIKGKTPVEEAFAKAIVLPTPVIKPSVENPVIEPPVQKPAVTEVKQLTEENNIQQEINQIIKDIKNYSGFFTQKDIEDIQMYYPIYKEVGKKWDVDWRLLWIIHDQETRCSSMKETNIVQNVSEKLKDGTVIKNSTYGAMQRDRNFYPDNVAEEALKGLEYLKQIPTRNKDDAREIAFAAQKINADLKKSNGVLHDALKKYSNEYQANKRLKLFNYYEKTILPKSQVKNAA